MSDEASAVPDNLMGYSNKAQPHNRDLESIGADLSRKLAAFLATNPDPKVLPQLRDLGKELTAYATKKASIDQWVYDVGLAFLEAGEKQVPSSVAGSYWGTIGLGSRLTTTTNATLEKDLTDNALTQQARRNADQLKDLLEFGSPEYLESNEEEIAKLANWLDIYKDDPIQAAAFFDELGADKTLTLVNAIQFLSLGDDKRAQLSRSLASATQSDTFDSSFARDLVHASVQADPSWPGSTDQRDRLAALLGEGMFSSAFLRDVGDEYFYNSPSGTGTTTSPGPLEMDSADPVVEPFFNALARNPEAAYQYLTGTSPWPELPPAIVVMGHEGNPSGDSRLAQFTTFLRTAGGGFPEDGWIDAFNETLLAADREASDSGSAAQVTTLLQDLSGADLDMVADGYRPAIAQLVSEHIGTLVPPQDPDDAEPPVIASDWTWQERLVKGAVANGDGDLDLGRVGRIQDAIQQWSLQQAPRLDGDSSSGDAYNRVRAYMYQVGELWGLSALPVRQAGYDYAQLKEAQAEGFSNLVGLIPIKVPGLDSIADEGLRKLAEYLSDQAIAHAEDYAVGQFKPNDDLDAATVGIYYQHLARMRLMLSQQFVAEHPDVVHGMSQAEVGGFISELAKGGDPLDGKVPAVSHFEGHLDSASLAFANQFNNPGRE